MIEIYNTILYEPVLNLLIYLHNVVPGSDIGLAILILTILIKVLLFPFNWQAIKSQKALQDIQPKLEAIKKKFKNDKEKLTQETMLLYKEQKVNPLSSCLPILVQFPFLIAVYQAFRTGLGSNDLSQYLYTFVANPEHVNTITMYFFDLAKPSIILAVLAGAAQFIQTKMLSTTKTKKPIPGAKDENMMASMNKNMLYFMPLITVVIGSQLPAGLTLYWLLTTVFTAVQQKFVFARMKKDGDVEVIGPEETQENKKAPHGGIPVRGTKKQESNEPDVKKLGDY